MPPIRLVSATLLCAALSPAMMAEQDADIDHVLLISVDGMHGSDLTKLRAVLPNGNLVRLMDHGVTYADARCTGPSDSQPGLVALVTGGTPKSAGMFYDASYSRILYAPGSVAGATPGTTCVYDETIEFDDSLLDGGGGIDPAKLPLTAPLSLGGHPVYPHEYLRDNTIFEVIKAAGMRTAWSDKSWGYEFVEGRSGHGCSDVYFPEVKSGPDYTTGLDLIRSYDALKVTAVVNWIHGLNHDGSVPAGGKQVANICGMNFQSVSVGQKLVIGGVAQGGYTDAPGNPMTPGMITQFQFVDDSIGQMVDALKAEHVYEHTLIVISAKHGQAPINPDLTLKIGDQIGPIVGARAATITEDDVALIWLTPAAQAAGAAAVVADLLKPANVAAAHIKHVIWGNEIAQLYRSPLHDDRTPDIIVVPEEGVIYTHSKAKHAEHGGFNEDDRHVGLLVANPRLRPGTVERQVFTTQIAPTILETMGLDPCALSAVREEGTRVLPGLRFRDRDDRDGINGDG